MYLPKRIYEIMPPQIMAIVRDIAYVMNGVFRPISLNLENLVPSPIARNVREKNITLKDSVPNVAQKNERKNLGNSFC